MRSSDLRVLFRAPAGPRRGFGHLLRCRSLARALGVRPVVALRGTRVTHLAATRLGVTVVTGGPTRVLRTVRPDVVIVDDLIANHGARWIECARRLRIPVVGIHDLGLGCLDADLVVDGSVVTRVPIDSGRTLTGLPHAVLDPAFARPVPHNARRGPTVLIALGGGPRSHRAFAIAEAIVRRVPGVRVRIAGGLAPRRAMRPPVSGVSWTGPLDGLRDELTRCDVAVTAGGLSLYEACAAGVASVALPVVRDQAPTVCGFGTRGGCVALRQDARASVVAEQVAGLLADRQQRLRLGRTGRRLVDGGGALRVATAIRQLVEERVAA